MITQSTIYNLCPYVEFEVRIRKWYWLRTKVIVARVWYTPTKLVDYAPKKRGIAIPFDELNGLDELLYWLDENGHTITKVKNKRGGS